LNLTLSFFVFFAEALHQDIHQGHFDLVDGFLTGIFNFDGTVFPTQNFKSRLLVAQIACRRCDQITMQEIQQPFDIISGLNLQGTGGSFHLNHLEKGCQTDSKNYTAHADVHSFDNLSISPGHYHRSALTAVIARSKQPPGLHYKVFSNSYALAGGGTCFKAIESEAAGLSAFRMIA
jgi:hypothetical protein